MGSCQHASSKPCFITRRHLWLVSVSAGRAPVVRRQRDADMDHMRHKLSMCVKPQLEVHVVVIEAFIPFVLKR